MKIKQQRRRVENETYSMSWEWVHLPGAGFGFPCDRDGHVAPLTGVAQAHYEMCLRGHDEEGHELIMTGRTTYVNRYIDPAIGVCDRCGADVVLDHALANTCVCGAEYNLSGQRLAPREQWGDDTGETLGEILEGNVNINDQDIDRLFGL